MHLIKNKNKNYFTSNNFLEHVVLFFLITVIFNFDNFDNFFKKNNLINFVFCMYCIFYFISNLNKFIKIKDIIFVLIFMSYLISLQTYHLYNQANFILESNDDILNGELIRMIFNLSLFSFLFMIKKNWFIFFEKLLYTICFFLIIIFIQNYIILDKAVVTSDIFFDYQDYDYNWASKNFIAAILNITLIFLNINFIKKKSFFFIFIILSAGIILTYSRAGYILYLINVIYLILRLENKNLKIIFVIIFFILSSVFWNETAKNSYIEKKINLSDDLYKPGLVKPDFFNKKWFNRDTKSLRGKYLFITKDNIKKNFLFGNGLGSFKEENIMFHDDGTIKRRPGPHSTWLLLLYETGIVGFLMYSFLLFKNKYYLLKKEIKFKYDLFYFSLIIISTSFFINIMLTPIIWFFYSMRLHLDNEFKIN